MAMQEPAYGRRRLAGYHAFAWSLWCRNLEGKHVVVVVVARFWVKPMAIDDVWRQRYPWLFRHSVRQNLSGLSNKPRVHYWGGGKPEFIKAEWSKDGAVRDWCGLSSWCVGDIELAPFSQPRCSLYTRSRPVLGQWQWIHWFCQTLDVWPLNNWLMGLKVCYCCPILWYRVKKWKKGPRHRCGLFFTIWTGNSRHYMSQEMLKRCVGLRFDRPMFLSTESIFLKKKPGEGGGLSPAVRINTVILWLLASVDLALEDWLRWWLSLWDWRMERDGLAVSDIVELIYRGNWTLLSEWRFACVQVFSDEERDIVKEGVTYRKWAHGFISRLCFLGKKNTCRWNKQIFRGTLQYGYASLKWLHWSSNDNEVA